MNKLLVANRRLVQICHNRSLKTKDNDNYNTLLTRPWGNAVVLLEQFNSSLKSTHNLPQHDGTIFSSRKETFTIDLDTLCQISPLLNNMRSSDGFWQIFWEGLLFLFQNDWPGRPVLPFGKRPSEVSLLLIYVFIYVFLTEFMQTWRQWVSTGPMRSVS